MESQRLGFCPYHSPGSGSAFAQLWSWGKCGEINLPILDWCYLCVSLEGYPPAECSNCGTTMPLSGWALCAADSLHAFITTQGGMGLPLILACECDFLASCNTDIEPHLNTVGLTSRRMTGNGMARIWHRSDCVPRTSLEALVRQTLS